MVSLLFLLLLRFMLVLLLEVFFLIIKNVIILNTFVKLIFNSLKIYNLY